MRSHVRRAASVAAVLTVLCAASSAHAFKPYTHVYAAQEAWEDAKDGKVTLHYTTYLGGNNGVTPTPIGDFDVDPDILRAIRANPQLFYAGALGPDAYPDIVSGQSRIHPPNGTGNDPDANPGGSGTDMWMQELWAAAWGSHRSDENIAFTTGFLAHAAGDLYAHSYVNYYSGGIFHLLTPNMTKHLVLEGYVAERTPPLRKASYDYGIPPALAPYVGPDRKADPFDVVSSPLPSSVVTLLAEMGVDSPGSTPKEDGKGKSLPWIFYSLRQSLRGAVLAFEQALLDKQRVFDAALATHQADLADMAKYLS